MAEKRLKDMSMEELFYLRGQKRAERGAIRSLSRGLNRRVALADNIKEIDRISDEIELRFANATRKSKERRAETQSVMREPKKPMGLVLKDFSPLGLLS